MSDTVDEDIPRQFIAVAHMQQLNGMRRWRRPARADDLAGDVQPPDLRWLCRERWLIPIEASWLTDLEAGMRVAFDPAMPFVTIESIGAWMEGGPGPDATPVSVMIQTDDGDYLVPPERQVWLDATSPSSHAGRGGFLRRSSERREPWRTTMTP